MPLIRVAVETFSEVEDSLAVGQKMGEEQEDERVVLFLKMAKGVDFSQDLVHRLRHDIRTRLSPRHVPAVILPIADIPVHALNIHIGLHTCVVYGEWEKGGGGC